MEIILYLLHKILNYLTGKITAGVDEIWSNRNALIFELFSFIIFSVSNSSFLGLFNISFVKLIYISFTCLVLLRCIS
jgi:hypothetical protein